MTFTNEPREKRTIYFLRPAGQNSASVIYLQVKKRACEQ